MKRCIVSFSGRQEGNCARIAREAAACFPGDEIALFDLSAQPLRPCGGCRCECFADGRACPHIGDAEYPLLNALTHSDWACLIVPNYCDYPGALYFAFNERSLCYFSGHEALLERYGRVPKKFIVVSGTERAHFEEAFSQQTGGEAPELLMLSAKAYGRSSVAGDLMDDPAAREAVRAFVTA